MKVALTSRGLSGKKAREEVLLLGTIYVVTVGVVGFNACQGHFDLWIESFGVNLCLFSSLFSP